MLIRAVITLLLGIVIGFRYKVGALFLILILLLVFAVSDDVVHGRDPWSITLSLIMALVCAEAGYLLGSVVQPLLRGNRASEGDRAGGAEALSGEPARPKQIWYEEGSKKTSSDF